MTGAVVLAAGAGRRLGGVNKALLEAGGDSFLGRITSTARGAGVLELIVVVGPPHEEATAAEGARLGLVVARNPMAARGMASSVAIGFATALVALSSEVAFLWPVDHVGVMPATVAALIGQGSPERWVVPVHAGRGGHPALVGRALWPALARCAELPGGARAVRDAAPARIVRIDVGDPGVVADVDTPADLR